MAGIQALRSVITFPKLARRSNLLPGLFRVSLTFAAASGYILFRVKSLSKKTSVGRKKGTWRQWQKDTIFTDHCKPFRMGTARRAGFIRCRSWSGRASGRSPRLPVSLQIVLESVLRNYDGKRVSENDIRHAGELEARTPSGPTEIPFVVARIVLQDFTGVPLLVDLAAMRSAVARHGARRRDHRAAGPGGPGRGPLGPGGLHRGARCPAAEHGAWSSSATAPATSS